MKTSSKKYKLGILKLDSGDSKDSAEFKREDETMSNHEQEELETTEIQENEDPFGDTDFEANESLKENKDDIEDDKFISDTRRRIVAVELETAKLARDRMTADRDKAEADRDKAEAESFMAQLKRNMAIDEYNKILGKNVPLFPLSGSN